MNYVQIRFDALNNGKSQFQIKHDLRLEKPDYLREDQWHNQFNNTTIKDYNYFSQNDINLPYDEKLKILEKYKSDRKELNIIQRKERRRSFREKDSTFLSGIITLSNTINEQLKKGEVEKYQLDIVFENTLKSVHEKLSEIVGEEIELYYGVIHYDEKTPHLHFGFKNKFGQNKSVFGAINRKEILSEFQELVGEGFKKLGFNRGIKKDITNSKHLTVVKMHQEEIKGLKKEIKGLQNRKMEINSDIELLLQTKTNISLELKKLKEERSFVAREIKKIKTTLKKLQQSVKNKVSKSIDNNTTMGFLTNKEALNKDLTDIVLNHIEKVDIKSIKNLENEVSKTKTENKKLENEVSKTKTENKKLENEVSKTKTENKKLENEVSKTKTENIELKSENIELKSKIEKVETENKKLKITNEENRERIHLYSEMQLQGDKQLMKLSKKRKEEEERILSLLKEREENYEENLKVIEDEYIMKLEDKDKEIEYQMDIITIMNNYKIDFESAEKKYKEELKKKKEHQEDLEESHYTMRL